MLLNRDNRFNLANLITFGNIACGVIAFTLLCMETILLQ